MEHEIHQPQNLGFQRQTIDAASPRDSQFIIIKTISYVEKP